jgi:RNA polymerase sigma factor (sigma-70 family)
VRTNPYSREQGVTPNAAHLAQRVRAIIDSGSNRFDELVRVAELDPKSDLRFGDWRGLDLTGLDLRGFDFTGADLTGVRFDPALIGGAIVDPAALEPTSRTGAIDVKGSFVVNPNQSLTPAASDEGHANAALNLERDTGRPANIGVTGQPGSLAAPDFADLVEAVGARRDRKAFVALYDHFAPRICAYLLRLGVEPASAEDLTQEVMAKLWTRANQFDRNKSSVGTWLFRVARNARIDNVRRQRGEPPIGKDALSIPDPCQSPDDALNDAQWEQRVRAALANLPAEQLAIVKLAFFEGLSHSEIAEQTGVKLGTVKARIRLALTRLRRGL